MKQRLIDASQIENKFLHWLNEISKDITNGIYQGSEGDGIAACLEEIRGAPTIDPESLRPKGHWERPSKLLNIVNCTACKTTFPGDFAEFRYCPCCGCFMENKDDVDMEES